MKWLQDNPLGMILAAISGAFVLLALGMAIVWTLPVSVDIQGAETEVTQDDKTNKSERRMGSLSDYQVVNEKPVFNESRSPDIGDEELMDDGLDGDIEVKGAPDVKLTGVVITPGVKIASLTPADGNLETVRAREGESLKGEFVGWQVAAVNPRTVVLESTDGQSLELDLQIHDAKIEAPIVPVAATPVPASMTNAQVLAGQSSEDTGEEDEPLSRAEQIRQRIAERRAELRQEQEAQQPQNDVQSDPGAGGRTRTKDYQTAIREMMKNKSKDQGGNDKSDG